MALNHDERNYMTTEFNRKCVDEVKRIMDVQHVWADALAYGVEIPYDAYRGATYHNLAQYGSDPETHEWILDDAKTVKEFAKVVKWAKDRGYKVEKKYTEDDFNLYIETPVGSFNFYSTRKVVCKKIVTGTKVVPAQPEKIEDVTEWVCEKVAFLAVDTD